MKQITVQVHPAYGVLVGEGLLDRLGELSAGVSAGRRDAVITDDTVDGLYGGRAVRSLEEEGFSACKYVFPHGKGSKNLAVWGSILAFLAENRLTRSDLDLGSLQGDRAMLAMAALAGAEAAPGAGALTVRRGRLLPLDTDVSETPDLVPALAALAALTPGVTRIMGAARLRAKESDRLAALADSLGALGADIRQTLDGLLITGRTQLRGGTADGLNDHRIVMALAVAALGCREPMVIRGGGGGGQVLSPVL